MANTAMKQMDLPLKFQLQVQEFLIFTQGTKSEQTQLKKFLEMISPSLAEKVSILIFSKVIQKNRRFKMVFRMKQKILTQSMGFKVDMQEIVSMMISKFKTELREPENTIVKQFDQTDSIYLIAKGACEVFIIDEKKHDKKIKNLRPGEYFGEISLIYGCKRTSSVNSSKYSTLAMLNKTHYKEILIEFPDLQSQLKKSIFAYKDRMKIFIKNSIQKVEYFQNIGDDALHDIIYNLSVQKYNKYELLQQPGDNATTLYFLQDGVIEIFTKTEHDHEFVLEKLFRGSIINYRTFFMEESGKVFYRFGRNSICSALSISKMEEIAARNPDLRKNFTSFKQKTILLGKLFPLDYIMNLPRHLIRKEDVEYQNVADRLENTLKNIVIRRLTDIRVLKAKPSLKDMVAAYLNKIGEKDERLRVRIKDQVLQIYEEKTFKQFEDNDPNFNKIIVHIERVLKITTAQTLAIDSLERKITNLSKRNPTQQRDIVITTQDEKIKALIEDRRPEHVEAPGEDSD